MRGRAEDVALLSVLSRWCAAAVLWLLLEWVIGAGWMLMRLAVLMLLGGLVGILGTWWWEGMKAGRWRPR